MTDPTYQWLPERHLGVVATLSHADELIEQIGDLLFQYQAGEHDVIGLREVLNGTVSQTVVEHIAPIPRKVALLVADALVALRGAIEHILFSEVEFLNGGPLDEKGAKTIEMPARLTHDDFADWVKSRSRHAPASMQSGSELVRRISGLQPFHRQTAPAMHPLARLVSHTNHAKHRTPAITAVRLAAIVRDDEVPLSVRDLPLRSEEPLRVGEVIAETPLGTRVPVALFPTVGINRPGTDEWPVLMRELEEIADWVRTQAVPRLITGAEPPEPALPARYEISVGHPDERHAIALGSAMSAAERNKRRMGAASARNNLIDLLHSVQGAPGWDQISAWIAQMTDDEVLNRVSQLKAGDPRDPNVIEGNLAAIQALRDEAIAFATP